MTPAPAHGDGPTGPSTPTGHTALRDRIAQEIHLHCPARPYGGNCRCTTLADAVMPVVEAETARVEADTLTALTAARDQRHRAEKAERERDTAREALDAAAIVIASLRDQRDDASKRAEEAEARNRRYDTAIAAERRDKLTAEAAVRRAQALADRWSAALGVDIAHARALREALTIEQPEETP